jgi:hypothetical protein
MAIGATLQFTATVTYSDASTQDLTDAVTWSSSSPGVATVSNAGGSEGLATAASAGSATITATDMATAIGGSSTLTVVSDITFRAADSGTSTGTTLAVPTPTAAQTGDLLIAAIAVRPGSAAVTPPPGWTLVRLLSSTSGNTSSLAVYHRLATAGEPAAHTWSFSTSTGAVGGIAAFYGVGSASPLDGENGQSTASGLTHATPSLTTAQADTMLVSAHAFSSSAAWTPPGGMTEALEVASLAVPNDGGISLELNYVLQPAAGATGVKSAVASTGPDTGNVHILALAPGP